jgi:hypothetical protein
VRRHDGYRLIARRDGDRDRDLRRLPLIEREGELARLLRAAHPGLIVTEFLRQFGSRPDR